MGLVADVNSSRIRMHYFQADILGMYLPGQLPALFSIPARRTSLGAPRRCLRRLALLALLALPSCFHVMLSSLFEIAARLGRRNLTISPAGSSRVLFQGQSPPPYSQSPITEATLTLGH